MGLHAWSLSVSDLLGITSGVNTYDGSKEERQSKRDPLNGMGDERKKSLHQWSSCMQLSGGGNALL